MGLQQSDVLALIALLVSLVALFTTVLQVLQQYFSSAEGYRRCADSVMGKWADTTKRKFRRKELRYEVVFETPVLFLAKPDNPFGPIKGRPINYMDGSPESYRLTRTLEPVQQDIADKQARARVHTADDERASWVTLLISLQQEERESREWDRQNFQTPKGKIYPSPTYSLCVGLQAKVRSWDFMPTAISRPFATTTICHLVEMVAMLGMYWKNFDQMNWNLRAEGNGFIITGSQVHGLGLMVVFTITGKSFFHETRLVPNDDVKELCFGSVPTIFKDSPNATPKSLSFGNREDIDPTLQLLGITPENITGYHAKHKHLFSVAFEIIGMLAIPIRIRGSNFKRIPNPTRDYYTTAFSKVILMEEFQAKLRSLVVAKSIDSSLEIDSIFEHWSKIQVFWRDDESNFDIDVREALHDALDASTTYLRNKDSKVIIRVIASHLNAVIQSLDELEPQLSELDAKKEEVFVEHYFDTIRPIVIKNRRRSETPNVSKAVNDERNSIWITLVFRMLYWLLLHDFDRVDLKIVPSDLKGSRMPVYIG